MNIAVPVRQLGPQPGAEDRLDPAGSLLDYDIHGLLGIRLVGATPRDRRCVERQLGLTPSAFDGDPALVLRFVTALPITEPLHFLGRDDVAFTRDAFVILRSRSLARARAIIRFDSLADRWDIICECGISAIPFLNSLINLAMIARGVLPVHATAFNFHGRGVLVAGWSHGGKTGTLLSFMREGARFVGDEWIYVGPHGDRMYGLPTKLEARSTYLRDLPAIRAHVPAGDRFRMAASRRLGAMLAPLVPASERRSGVIPKLIRHAHHALLEQQSVELCPKLLFGAAVDTLRSSLDHVILALSHSGNDVVVEAATSDLIAARITHSFLHEQANFLSCYRKQLFAFPDRRNALIDRLEHSYHGLALGALAGKRTFLMSHPYPVSTARLTQALTPIIG